VASPTAGQQAQVATVLSRLGTTASSWRRYQVACPDGGELTTVEAFASTQAAGPLNAKIGPVAGGRPVVTAADLYAYVLGSTQIAVRALTGGVDITATVLCGQ
jgi:hypothetical protein